MLIEMHRLRLIAVLACVCSAVAGCGDFAGGDGDLCPGDSPPEGSQAMQMIMMELIPSSVSDVSERSAMDVLHATLAGCEIPVVERVIDVDLCANAGGCASDVFGGSVPVDVYSVRDVRTVALVVEDSTGEELFAGDADVTLSGAGTLARIDLLALATSESVTVKISR